MYSTSQFGVGYICRQGIEMCHYTVVAGNIAHKLTETFEHACRRKIHLNHAEKANEEDREVERKMADDRR